MAFGTLGLERRIVAFTLVDNIASRRVMEKAEFEYERELEHVGLPHVLYRRPKAAPIADVVEAGRCVQARQEQPAEASPRSPFNPAP